MYGNWVCCLSVCLGLEVGVASKRFFSHTEHLSNLIAALSELYIRKTKRRSCAFYAIRVLSYRSYFPLQVGWSPYFIGLIGKIMNFLIILLFILRWTPSVTLRWYFTRKWMPHWPSTTLGLIFKMDLFILDKVMGDQLQASFHLSFLQVLKPEFCSVYAWGRQPLKV